MSAILAFVSPTTGDYTVVEFDVITGEEHNISAQISEHPVEEGANVTDHVRPDLQKVQLKAVVTDSPINQVTAFGLSPAPLHGLPGTMVLNGRQNKQLSTFSIKGGYNPLTLPGNLPIIGDITVPTNGFKPPFVAPTFTPGEWGTQSTSVAGTFLQFDTPMKRVAAVFKQLEFMCNKGIECEVSTDVRFYERMLIESVSAPRNGTDSIEFTIQFKELRTAKTQKTFVKRKAKPKKKDAVAKVEQGKKVAPQTVPDASTVARILLEQFQKSSVGKALGLSS